MSLYSKHDFDFVAVLFSAESIRIAKKLHSPKYLTFNFSTARYVACRTYLLTIVQNCQNLPFSCPNKPEL